MPRLGDRGCGRASLPVVQRDHGGEVQAVDEVGIADLGIDAGSVGWAGGGQEIVAIEPRPLAKPARSSKTKGTGTSASWLSSKSSRSSEEATWEPFGYTQKPLDGKVATITLELLAKARQLGDAEAFYAGGDADAIAAELGAHGATKVHTTGDLDGGLAGPALPGAWPAQSLAAQHQLPSCSAPPRTGATWPAACRSSSTRPVITNVVELDDDGGLVGPSRCSVAPPTSRPSSPAIGRHLPDPAQVLRSRSCGGGAAAVETLASPTSGPPAAPRCRTVSSKSPTDPSSTRPQWWSRGPRARRGREVSPDRGPRQGTRRRRWRLTRNRRCRLGAVLATRLAKLARS